MDNLLILHAPMNGVLIPIEKVPDPAFAEKMIGDGFSIDPTEGLLRAPCDGTVIHIHKSLHAVTIQTDDRIEVLLHIGIDTVNLKGDGFSAETTEGASVKTGDPLISFEMSKIAQNAPHLLTQVLISTMERVEKLEKIAPGEVEAGCEVCKVFCKSEDANLASDSSTTDGTSTTGEVIIPNPLGLHARPAAVFANFAKTFDAKIELINGSNVGNAKSVTSIMKLNTKLGDKITIKVTGQNSNQTLSKLIAKIKSGLGEEVSVIEIGATEPQEQAEISYELPPGCSEVKGIPASGGIAVGTAFILKEAVFNYKEDSEEPQTEAARLDIAITKVKNEIIDIIKELDAENSEKAEIFAAHLEIIEDPEIRKATESLIAEKKSAEFAWNSVCQREAEALQAMNNALLAARAIDLKDVSLRLLGALQNVDISPKIPEGSIVLTNELTPSMTAEMDPEKIKGFCTVTGGATSHVAILAKSLGIPAVVGVHPGILTIENGSKIVIDAFKGVIKLNVSDEEAAKFAEIQSEQKKKRAEAFANADKPATTTDGKSIEIAGNAGTAAEVTTMIENGGEGIGLLRSEFIFVNRVTAPTEDQQFEVYKKALQSAGKDRRVIIRTLDVGGDKPLTYMPLPKEENPFLGERGIRVSLKYPEIFRVQLRALLRASEFGKLQIMFPMIGGLNDWIEAKAILDEERQKLGTEKIPVGVMIEVPSAALMADQLAKEVDFFSIGTNDLTQYTVAIDRGHSTLADKADALDPAVLRLIKMTVDAAHKNSGWVGVCGAIGEDPQAISILLGLGVDELSVSIPIIPTVKAQVRSLTEKNSAKLAEKALNATTASEVRALSHVV